MLMLRVIHFVIVLSFFSEVLAAYYGDVRIRQGGRDGLLEFDIGGNHWGTVCSDGFDDDDGDVACRQLGYLRSSDVYVKNHFDAYVIKVCYVDCGGNEDRLQDCYIRTNSSCHKCSGDVVGITCTNTLTAEMVAGIVIGVLVFVGLITTCVIVCFCCLVPTCPCYYRSSRTTRTVVVTQPTAQVVTATTTSAKATNYQPPPPAYVPDTGYQPYPPTATTAKY